jgi:hypothetical protein
MNENGPGDPKAKSVSDLRKQFENGKKAQTPDEFYASKSKLDRASAARHNVRNTLLPVR